MLLFSAGGWGAFEPVPGVRLYPPLHISVVALETCSLSYRLELKVILRFE